jgi:hypothetical protein
VQRVEYLLLQLEISDSKREFLQSSVKWEIMADKKRLDSFRKRAGRMITEL